MIVRVYNYTNFCCLTLRKKQLKSISKENSQDLLSFEESDIENRGIEIDELENKDFECEVIFVFCLRTVHF